MWYKTSERVPNDGQLVRIISYNGAEMILRYLNGLWFTFDWAMCLCYTPEWWSGISENEAQAS